MLSHKWYQSFWPNRKGGERAFGSRLLAVTRVPAMHRLRAVGPWFHMPGGTIGFPGDLSFWSLDLTSSPKELMRYSCWKSVFP